MIKSKLLTVTSRAVVHLMVEALYSLIANPHQPLKVEWWDETSSPFETLQQNITALASPVQTATDNFLILY